MPSKKCTKCGELKPLEEFHRNRAAKDGRASRCRICQSAASRASARAHPEAVAKAAKRWREENPERVAALTRRSRAKKKNKERVSAYNRKYREQHPELWRENARRTQERHPEKARARRAVTNAVRDGRLIKPDRCEDCGQQFENRLIQGHHEDYSRPLDVRWLCRACHFATHARVREEAVA